MADYQRFISYIYAYDGEIKLNNVGFAKMEERGGRCRIGLSLKGAHGVGSKANVYAVRRGPAGLAKIWLGAIALRAGQGEFAYVAEGGRVGGETCRLSDLSGLYIADGDGERFFFTGWDDGPVRGAELRGRVSAKAPCVSEAGTAISQAASQETMPESGASAQEAAAAAVPVQAAELNSQVPEAEVEQVIRRARPEEKLWELLCKVSPKMLPAPGTEAWQLLEIQIQDIGRLPRKNWIYGNNSFLVQGFYHYGHLLLGRKEADGQAVYWLGVPGLQNETERLLSGMFGFREFLPGNRRKGEDFGYWCTEVAMKDL